MKSHFHTSKAPKKDGVHSLLDDINEARYALESAYMGFDNATDPDLIDCYIYEMNSILKRYRFLLHELQSFGFTFQDNTVINTARMCSLSIHSQTKYPLFTDDPIELIPNP